MCDCIIIILLKRIEAVPAIFCHKNIVSNRTTNNQAEILIYLFADAEYHIPGFNTEFADWFTKKEIENFATKDGTQPWITPQKEEYFLTKFYRVMEPADMTEDLYPQKDLQSVDQNNPSLSPKQKTTGLYSLVFLSVLSVVAMIVYVVLHNKDK